MKALFRAAWFCSTELLAFKELYESLLRNAFQVGFCKAKKGHEDKGEMLLWETLMLSLESPDSA